MQPDFSSSPSRTLAKTGLVAAILAVASLLAASSAHATQDTSTSPEGKKASVQSDTLAVGSAKDMARIHEDLVGDTSKGVIVFEPQAIGDEVPPRSRGGMQVPDALIREGLASTTSARPLDPLPPPSPNPPPPSCSRWVVSSWEVRFAATDSSRRPNRALSQSFARAPRLARRDPHRRPASRASRRSAQRHGRQADPLLHAKTAVIDDVWATVGSANMDWRSFLHNDELNTIVLDKDFGKVMTTMFEADRRGVTGIDRARWEIRGIGDRMK